MRNEIFSCEICGQEYPISKQETFDGQFLCSNCLTAETITCSACGERIWRVDNAGDEETPLCQNCYDRITPTASVAERCCGRMRPVMTGTIPTTRNRCAVSATTGLPVAGPSRITITNRSLSSTETAPGSSVWNWSWMWAVKIHRMPGRS